MGRVAAFLFERRGLSEQRGWAPRALSRDVRALEAMAKAEQREAEGEPVRQDMHSRQQMNRIKKAPHNRAAPFVTEMIR
jgi:hypothetical protein